MIKNCIINLQVYPFDVMVSINESNKSLEKNLKDFIDPSEIKDYMKKWDEDLPSGRVIMFTGLETLLRMQYYDNTPYWFGILAHEILHCVEILLERLGMVLTRQSAEAYTYLTGFLTEKIYEKFKLIRK